MGQIIIRVPEAIYQEYDVASIHFIEPILQELKQKVDRLETDFQENWRQSLFAVSTWTEKDIAEIEAARTFINQWQPQQLS